MTRLWPEGEPLNAWGDGDAPDGFRWQGRAHRVASVHNRWQVHTLWWQPEGAIWREYVKVTTDGGLLCLLYRDLVGGDSALSSRSAAVVPVSRGWFLARVYD